MPFQGFHICSTSDDTIDHVAEETFGVDLDIPASTTTGADQPADDADFVLEEALGSVMKNNAAIGNVRVLANHNVVFLSPFKLYNQSKGRKQTMKLHKSSGYNARRATNTVWFQVVNA